MVDDKGKLKEEMQSSIVAKDSTSFRGRIAKLILREQENRMDDPNQTLLMHFERS